MQIYQVLDGNASIIGFFANLRDVGRSLQVTYGNLPNVVIKSGSLCFNVSYDKMGGRKTELFHITPISVHQTAVHL